MLIIIRSKLICKRHVGRLLNKNFPTMAAGNQFVKAQILKISSYGVKSVSREFFQNKSSPLCLVLWSVYGQK
jgi:hypothetical protein